MQVSKIEIRHVRIPLIRAIEHASKYRLESDNIVISCQLNDGSIGWGEGVPREYVTGETIDSTFEVLRTSNLSSLTEPVSSFAQAVHLIESLKLKTTPNDDRKCKSNSARCALELGLLDAFGRAYGEPLMNVVRLLEPEQYEPKEWVRYSAAITKARGLKSKLYPFILRWMGFEQLKVKVGIQGIDDVKRTACIRRWAGKEMDIRLDANESWTSENFESNINKLMPFNISSIEQPLPHDQIGTLTELRKRIAVPIMLDESLCSEADAERAVQERLCDYFNIRLSKCGGFIPSLRLASFASRHKIGIQLGCQVGESAILSAAGRHFATSVRGLRFLEGSYDRHLVRDSLAVDDITIQRGGKAPMLTGSGLGIRIDPERVDALTVRREVIFGE
jgi:L-Ala-D/L-Glu epimerase